MDTARFTSLNETIAPFIERSPKEADSSCVEEPSEYCSRQRMCGGRGRTDSSTPLHQRQDEIHSQATMFYGHRDRGALRKASRPKPGTAEPNHRHLGAAG